MRVPRFAMRAGERQAGHHTNPRKQQIATDRDRTSLPVGVDNMRGMTTSLMAVILTGCSAAGWQGYGLKGKGHIGSAYGYQDQYLGSGWYLVSYTGFDGFSASDGLSRRATELCEGRDYDSRNEREARHSSILAPVGGAWVSTEGLVDAVAEIRCK